MIKIETRIFLTQSAAQRHAQKVEALGGEVLVVDAANLAVWEDASAAGRHAEAYVDPPNRLWVVVTRENTD